MVFSAMHVFRRVKLLLWALLLAVAVPDGSAAATLSAEVSAESVFLGDAFTLAISLDGAPAAGGTPAIEKIGSIELNHGTGIWKPPSVRSTCP